MKKRSRNILFLIFILIFLVVTPLTILYAIGYKLDLSRPLNFNTSLQKTGALIIESNPEGAYVLIDGEKIQDSWPLGGGGQKSPAMIKGLLPGEYEISLEIINYQKWKKKISIKAGQSTYLDKIELFLKTKPLLFNEAPMEDLYFSPDNKFALFTDKNNFINYFDTKNELTVKIESLKINNLREVSWHQNNEKILFGGTTDSGEEFYIYNRNNNEVLHLNEIFGNKMEMPKIDQTNANLLFYIIGERLHEYDLKRNADREVLKCRTAKTSL
jgi:hypothetical protein